MLHKFKVLRSSESPKGGFINALETTTSMKVLGQVKTTKHIVSIKTDEAVEVGSEFDLDTDAFEIRTYTNEYLDPKTGELRIGENKWLHAKLG